MELTIGGKVFEFRFGLGFYRAINAEMQREVPGIKNGDVNIGFQYWLSLLIEGRPDALVHILDLANKGMVPRVTVQELDAYIDDPNTDIDALMDEVLGFLRTSNATRKQTIPVLEAVEK